jgi:hypothetical protein
MLRHSNAGSSPHQHHMFCTGSIPERTTYVHANCRIRSLTSCSHP